MMVSYGRCSLHKPFRYHYQVTQLALIKEPMSFCHWCAWCRGSVILESKLFPPHNIIVTSGGFVRPLADFYQEHKADPRVFGWINVIILLFQERDLDDIRLRERHVDTVILTGVLTDICVLHKQRLMPTIWLSDRSRRTCSGICSLWKSPVWFFEPFQACLRQIW